MNWVAWRMLVGDTTKYLGLVFGISFATLLMTQQISIFVGIMKRTASQVLDVRGAPIWIMDAKTRFIDEAPGIPDTDLMRVRGMPKTAGATGYVDRVVCLDARSGKTLWRQDLPGGKADLSHASAKSVSAREPCPSGAAPSPQRLQP